MAILNTCGDEHVEIGPDDGAKDQALPGSLLQTGFGLEYGGIVVERGAEDLLQSDRAGRVREGRDQNQNRKCEYWLLAVAASLWEAQDLCV